MTDYEKGTETSQPDDGNGTPFASLLRTRRSCRAYDPTRPVPREAIEQCVASARLAPSACNRQPWHFVVVRDPGKREQLCARARLPGIAHEWWDNVPAFVVLCARLDLLTHRLAPAISGIDYHLLDLGIAGEHFVLAATELGLGTCWIGWFRERTVRRILGIPRRVRVVALVALGYPAGVPGPPRRRRDVGDIVSWDKWDASS